MITTRKQVLANRKQRDEDRQNFDNEKFAKTDLLKEIKQYGNDVIKHVRESDHIVNPIAPIKTVFTLVDNYVRQGYFDYYEQIIGALRGDCIIQDHRLNQLMTQLFASETTDSVKTLRHALEANNWMIDDETESIGITKQHASFTEDFIVQIDAEDNSRLKFEYILTPTIELMEQLSTYYQNDGFDVQYEHDHIYLKLTDK